MAYRYCLIKMKGNGSRTLRVRRIPGTSRLEKVSARTANTTRAQAVSFDELTAKLLLRASRTWRLPEQEALRRALQPSASSDSQQTLSQLQAFNELQRRLNLTPAKAIEWQNAVRESRR